MYTSGVGGLGSISGLTNRSNVTHGLRHCKFFSKNAAYPRAIYTMWRNMASIMEKVIHSKKIEINSRYNHFVPSTGSREKYSASHYQKIKGKNKR